MLMQVFAMHPTDLCLLMYPPAAVLLMYRHQQVHTPKQQQAMQALHAGFSLVVLPIQCGLSLHAHTSNVDNRHAKLMFVEK
mgnify:CR=1 FL=1